MDYRAVWAGACPFAHRAHQAFRLLEGDLDFVEVPVTADGSRPYKGTDTLVWELRVEFGRADEHRVTIGNALKEMLAARPRVMTLVGLTHNCYDYASEDCEQVAALRGILAAVRQAAAANGLELAPATLAEVREAYLSAEAECGAQA